ncbi:DUF4363 family protein [Pantanalinema sp. GBBB05]|uniref:DUF4363 family protein n=1 Tax=Pantanalinema sp. GBBB05 TaxID=2604139 RepID=UPI001D815E83|nr:DUF4363 domain-containing protein [Pantanalinema sp. GBBB05]
MSYTNRLIAIAALCFLALAGCNTGEQANTPPASSTAPTAEQSTTAQPSTSPSATSGKTDTKTEASANQPGFQALTNVVAKTKTAVNAGDFTKAKDEFDQFEDSWSKVEDDVKAKSAKTYDAIEEGMDQTTAAIKASDKTKALAALQTLDQNIATAAKS